MVANYYRISEIKIKCKSLNNFPFAIQLVFIPREGIPFLKTMFDCRRDLFCWLFSFYLIKLWVCWYFTCAKFINGFAIMERLQHQLHLKKYSHSHTHICLQQKRHIENGQQNRITMWKWAAEPTKLRKTKYKSDPRNGISSGKFTMSFVHREIAHSSFGIRFGPIKHLFSQRRENQMIW